MSELPASVDTLVVGAGLTGAATAWALTRRGVEVAVLDRFGPANAFGSSHGSARIVRRAYADALYMRLTGRAFELWRELEHESGRPLLRMTGGIDHGSVRDVPTMATLMSEQDLPHELLPADEAERRWPGMRFASEVLFHPQAGTVDAERAVAAFLESAVAGGASVHSGTAVTAVEATAGDALVHVGDATIRARTVVLAAGAWLAPLTDGILELPTLTVTQQQIFHFARRDESADPWPVTIAKDGRNIYHLPGGRDGGPGDARKIAEHDGGTPTTADTRDRVVDPQVRERIVDYVRTWLPGLVDKPMNEASCLYTSTPTEDFVLDRVGPIVIASPCSGHGAKFAPLVGEQLAALASGEAADVPPRFTLAAHAATRLGV